MNRSRFLTISSIILVISLSRLIPHPPNFTPILATALFGGALLHNKRHALLIVLGSMFLSDVLIGFHITQPAVYLTLAVVVFFGGTLRNKIKALPIAFLTVGNSLFFFITTNFAVWAVRDYYPHTIEGLVLCYTAALPFLQTAMIGDLFYSALLFGGFYLLEKNFGKSMVKVTA